MEFKETKNLNTLIKKLKTYEDYIAKCEVPTYKDFLFQAEITSQDFQLLYEELINNNEKAKRIYYVLEKIKNAFEIKMEQLIIYQNHPKANYNYRLLKEIYENSINSPISLQFKSIENVGGTFITTDKKPNLTIPFNDSGVDIFDMRKKVIEDND